MTIIGVVSDKVITANAHSLCRLRDQLDRRATALWIAQPKEQTGYGTAPRGSQRGKSMTRCHRLVIEFKL